MLYIPWKYDVLRPNWCKYHANMRFCIQNAVNTLEMKDSRSGSRGPYHWGGATGPGTGIIYMVGLNHQPVIIVNPHFSWPFVIVIMENH